MTTPHELRSKRITADILAALRAKKTNVKPRFEELQRLQTLIREGDWND